MMSASRILPFLAVIALGACNATQPQPEAAMATSRPAPPNVTPSSFKLPPGAGCTGDIARWQAIQDNDHTTGNVNDSVYAQMQGETAKAAEACQAGRDGEARGLVSASKRKHGYPG